MAIKRKANEDGSTDSNIQGIIGTLNPAEKWISLDMPHIQRLMQFFDCDLNVRTAFNIRMDALLAGDIVFKRKNQIMHGDEEKQWYSETYSQFSRDLVRMLWTVGFAACSFVKDEEYIAKPVVLNMDAVDIEYRINALNQPEWLFYEREEGITSYDRKPMEHVHTFWWSDCVPGKAGNIRSYMEALMPDQLYEQQLQGCDLVAASSRCNPPLVTEAVEHKYDPDNVPSGTNSGKMSHGTGDGPRPEAPTTGSMIGGGPNAAQSVTELRQITEAIRTANAYNSSDIASINEEMRRNFARNFQSVPLKQFYLYDGRKYIKHTLAEGPGAEAVLKVQETRTDRVLALLGVPSAMLAQHSAVSGKKVLTENSMMLFNNAQKLLKKQVVIYMTKMYSVIYNYKHALEEYLTSKADMKNSKDYEDATRVEILLPGLPTDPELQQLWMTGCLKYEVYCEYVASKHGFEREAFYPKQQLSIEDLNSIKPDDETSK
jgi:hypothetical protein